MGHLCAPVRILVFVLAITLVTGCAPVATSTPTVANLQKESDDQSTPLTNAADINRSIVAAAALQDSTSSADYVIGPEDLLEITIFNIPETHGQVTPRTTTVRVNQQSQIALPLIGDISVKGLSVSALERTLRERFDKYIHNPQVGVLVREFRQRVSVIGAVQKPGPVELTGPKTVLEILAMTGGVNEKAGTQVHIYRRGPTGRDTHVIDLTVLANNIGLINATNVAAINMPVEPGDMINIPEAGMFFVDGAVKKPGSYPLGRRYTLTQAIAIAGGVDREIYSSDISIFRRHGPGEVENMALNLNAVVNGDLADPLIQPDDVIIVPTSTAKYLVRRFVGTLVGGISIARLPIMFGS